MAVSQGVIQVLIAVALVVLSGAAAAHIAMALGHRKAVIELRADIESTLRRVDAMVNEAEDLLRDEVRPTLKVARQTLQNVEVTTRALADTTVAARNVVSRIERTTNASRLAQVGGMATTLILKKGAGTTAGLVSSAFAGVGHAILGLVRRRIHDGDSERLSKVVRRNGSKDASGSAPGVVAARK